MLDNLSAISSLAKIQQQPALANSTAAQQVKEEFLALFYRELLKQSLVAPSLGLGNENESGSGSMVKMFANDMLVEKLALELARRGSISIDQFFPPAESGAMP